MNYTRSDSKVEVTGFEARHYDLFMNLITGGTYPFFIRQVVKDMQIQPADSILDLGSGTGRNISLMNKYLSEEGRVLGLDIGSEMLEQAQHRFANHPRVIIENRRIEEPLPYQDEFNKVFISFVLHGLIQEDRLKVIANVYRALKPGGEFLILDYNEFDLKVPTGRYVLPLVWNVPWRPISLGGIYRQSFASRASMDSAFARIIWDTCACWQHTSRLKPYKEPR
jgi:ubiquinone/menaquinone biosynthesis C-methylase UbiE